MAGTLNKAIIIGNLIKDAEVRSTNDGRDIANLVIATSESWKDKNSGEKKEKTEFHKISIFNPALADVAKKYLKKGMKVYVEGQLQTRGYEKDGTKRYSTEIVLQGYNCTLTMLEAPKKELSDEAKKNGYVKDDLDDVIPFVMLLPLIMVQSAVMLTLIGV